MESIEKNISRENVNKKALKAGLFYTICNFLIKALGFLTMPIFTRIMSKSDIGYFSNLQSWISILSIICTLELSSSIALAKYDFKNDINKYISSNLFLSNIFTAICYFSIMAFKSKLLPMMGLSDLEFHLCFIYLLVYPGLQLFQQKQQVFYRYKESTIVSLIGAFISTCLSIVFVLLFSNKYTGRLFGYFSPIIFLNLLLCLFLYIRGKCINPKYWKYALVISVPIIFHMAAGFALSTSDRLMITHFCGPEDNAYYSVAYSVSSIVQLLWLSVNSALAPWSIDQMDAKNYKSLKKITSNILLIFGVVCILYSLVSPELLLLMGGRGYYSASRIIPLIICGCIFQAAYTFYVNAETFLKKHILISIATITSALINVGLNFVFIPLFGYEVAALTTLIGYLCLFLIHFTFLVIMKKQWWFNTSFIFLFLLFSLCFTLLMSFLIDDVFKRYILLVLFILLVVVVTIFNKTTIANLVNSLRKK